LITAAPQLLALARALSALVAESPDDAPAPILDLARKAEAIERQIAELPPSPEPSHAEAAE
jgi:hypothetical protein